MFVPGNYKSETKKIGDVYQIKIDVPFPVKYVYVYIFKAGDAHFMFDAGLDMGNWGKIFFAELEKINLSPKDIDYCFVSHNHLDHIGMIRKLKRKNPDIKILMSEITSDILKWETNPDNSKEIEKAAVEMANQAIKYGISEQQGKRLVQWFTMWPNLRKYHEPDDVLHDGDEITIQGKKLRMIWTPGHALGHSCIFDEQKQFLFSGDHILSRITPHIGNFLVNPELNEKYDFEDILNHYLKSLDRIDKLHPRIIFPAHQEVIYDPHERIMEIKKHHDKRLQEISSLIKNNPLTPLRISQIHFGEDLDEMNSYLALSEVLGHLIYLEKKNKVERIQKDGKILFIT
ncbi:MAG: MBL fold metallo-hydrolase [Promethearchaeota archaeon]|nr:MAG: MBL fold metallo-hydrolase [Candidatus Lokiarchaeota archaeon]